MYITAALPNAPCTGALGCTEWQVRPQGYTSASDSNISNGLDPHLIQLVAPPGGVTASDLVVSLTSAVPTNNNLAEVDLLFPGDQGFDTALSCQVTTAGVSTCMSPAGASGFIPGGLPFFVSVQTDFAVPAGFALNASWIATY